MVQYSGTQAEQRYPVAPKWLFGAGLRNAEKPSTKYRNLLRANLVLYGEVDSTLILTR
jgi:hypothetical protein